MKAQHLRDAQRFLAARGAFNAPTVRFAKSTRWQDDAGDTFATSFDIIPLPLATSVKQVYDALRFGWFNTEICMADRFGDTVVREACDTGNANISHHRLVSSSSSHGVLVETNSVLFAEHVHLPLQQRDAEVAVLVSDFVDSDALHPYVPAQRVRKDLTSAVTIQWRVPAESSSPSDSASAAIRTSTDTASKSMPLTAPDDSRASQPVVVLTMWTQSRLHSSTIRQAISNDRFEALTEETPDHMTAALLVAVNTACTPDSVTLADDGAATPVLHGTPVSL